MKASLNWLRDYVPIKIPLQKLVYKLTMAGLEVEKVQKVGGDDVLEFEITPNRPDCLSLWGIAREIAANQGETLKIPQTKRGVYPKKKCAVRIDDPESCHRYIGTLIENVHIQKAPQDIKKKIQSLGLRSVNNIVDLTNFSLLENGQPLHAFDFDKLIGGQIIVRRAKKGEKIITIDDVERELDPSVLVIADAKRPVAIAGIMGGKETEVTTKTKNILLESAYFQPVLIRRTSRKLGLSSDSSYRFERGVDMEMVGCGSTRAVNLILEHAGGAITARTDKTVSSRKKRPVKIKSSVDKINAFLGSKQTVVQIKRALTSLGCRVAVVASKQLVVEPPSWRADIKVEVDIFEEIARLIGYNHLPLSFPSVRVSGIRKSPQRIFREELRAALLALGGDEIITYTMINTEALKKTHQESFSVMRVANPLTVDQEIMRPTLLPSLLSVLQSNFNKGRKDLFVFELGKIYLPSGEREVLSLLMAGREPSDWRAGQQQKKYEFYDLKGVIEGGLGLAGVKNLKFAAGEKSFLEKGQNADILIGAQRIGFAGKVDSDVLKEMDIRQENVLFSEIDLQMIFSKQLRQKRYHPVCGYPAVVRDVSIAVKKGIDYQQVKDVVLKQNLPILAEMNFIEEYVGDKIPQDQKGLIFSLVYQSSSRTLVEDEVSAAHEKICQALASQLGAAIR